MKKAGLLLLVSGFFALALSSCGTAYTPMTEEQINAKVDSTFNAQKEAITTTANEACASTMEASVAAKVEELKAATTTTTVTK
jgi:hypothetical protein